MTAKRTPPKHEGSGTAKEPAAVAPLGENGNVAADFSPTEIEELRHALNNSAFMMRKKLRRAKERFLGER